MQLPKSYIFLFIVLGIMSVAPWAIIPLSNTTVHWLASFCIIFFNFAFFLKGGNKKNIKLIDRRLLAIYFTWLAINVVRGALYYTENNYWLWKQLVEGTLTLLLPCWILVLADARCSAELLRKWLRWGLLLFAPLSVIITREAWHFYLGPILFVGCFLFNIQKKWMLLVGLLMAAMCVVDLGARSQVLMSAVVFVVAFVYKIKWAIPTWLMKLGHIGFYVIGITLLYLGITGEFNVFEEILEGNKGKYYSAEKVVDDMVVKEDLADDTRTFIYTEVIQSAVLHDYVVCGRTPARGNDSRQFGDDFAIDLQTGLYERHSNELVHTNVFTWLGLIGLFLYSLFYVRASFLAVYRSRSFALKLLGCFVAFHWLYGWVEDFNRFDINNFSIWLCISVCLSEQFRRMSDKEFMRWLKSILGTTSKRTRISR